MNVDLHGVLDEIAERRRNRHDMNVATMTVVVFFDDAAVGEWARDRTHALAVKHPSRVLVLDGTQPSSFHRVGDKCFSHADCVKTRGDWIELGVSGGTSDVLLSAINTLCLPQAPIVLIWVASGIGADPRFAPVVSQVRSVVYNSSVLDDGDAALRDLATFVGSHRGAAIADLAYLRLAPWQEAIALFFDGRDVVRELFDLRRVEITCGSDSEAYYLLGWLASRLEWKPCDAEQLCNRYGTTIDFAIVREGRARRIRRVALHSSNTNFIAEIDNEDAEAILLTVTGEKQHPDRARPINNIDIAALVERAILTGHNDRVFVESLLAAGEILERRKGLTNA
ncbi:MAG: glucose-6-phosphate dehydrogenase assembly protein OpcA [Candidatus Eremiobacteraeota bacterium]|nr:glucose-6-phosphate dehydrogenase assembly protein OpcA [Candidatus Eremiobacteraeota bacterium]